MFAQEFEAVRLENRLRTGIEELPVSYSKKPSYL